MVGLHPQRHRDQAVELDAGLQSSSLRVAEDGSEFVDVVEGDGQLRAEQDEPQFELPILRRVRPQAVQRPARLARAPVADVEG